MSRFEWFEAVERVSPFVVKIETPGGFGTGFLFTYAGSGSICGVATAAHVLSHAHQWEEPIRLIHPPSGTNLILHFGERGVFVDEGRDSAAVMFRAGQIPFPADPLPLPPSGVTLKVGNEVGWVGFPGISPGDLCFFRGCTSFWNANNQTYFVDGVLINGVSGGPAFCPAMDGNLYLIGVASAYLPNTEWGSALPGLGVVRHVGHLQETVSTLQNLEQVLAQQTPPSSTSSPPPPPDQGGV